MFDLYSLKERDREEKIMSAKVAADETKSFQMVESKSCRMYFTIKWVLDRSYLCMKCCLREPTGKKKVPEY